MFKLAIHVEGGVVQRVEADADVLQNMEVAVFVDKQPARLLRPVIESAVTGYVESVRGAELAYRLASACQVIAHTFSALGGRDTQDAEAFLRDVEAAMVLISQIIEPTVTAEEIDKELDRLAQRVRKRFESEKPETKEEAAGDSDKK